MSDKYNTKHDAEVEAHEQAELEAHLEGRCDWRCWYCEEDRERAKESKGRMNTPKTWPRTTRGGYKGFAVAAKRHFRGDDNGYQREFALVAPDEETLLILWERIMSIPCDEDMIRPAAIEKPDDDK